MKKTILTILLCGILVLELTGCNINQYIDSSIDLKANWNIELPKNANMKEIYSADEGASFLGDGIRYHIFSYEKDDEIKEMLNWTNQEKETIFYSTYSESVNNWLNEIKVSKENYPNYSNCKYWYNKQNDNSEIIILWDSQETKLYIVESFL